VLAALVVLRRSRKGCPMRTSPAPWFISYGFPLLGAETGAAVMPLLVLQRTG
jgi:hypothetical protein